jgi:adenylate cyclase
LSCLARLQINEWLSSERARQLTDVEVVTAFGERMAKLAPVKRVATSVRTMHPEVFVRNMVWTAEKGTELSVRNHEMVDKSAYTASPIPEIYGGTHSIRVRLADPDSATGYEVCDQMREEGATDYIVYRLPLYDQTSSWVSYTTWEPDGFSDEHFATFESVLGTLSLRIALFSVLTAARSLLRTYLGPEASARVLRGAFTRGSGELMDAVIFTCDMRGFTTLVDSHPIEQVIQLLDAYFEAVAEPIGQHGGEILKLIGDAVLAVFPLTSDDACERALLAAEAALANVQKLTAPDGGPPRIGIGLHVGEVLYGNIGASDRLDFTVIGRAVNEVCRIEAKCKELGVDVLLTRAIAGRLRGREVSSVGRHQLRGVSGDTELFTL